MTITPSSEEVRLNPHTGVSVDYTDTDSHSNIFSWFILIMTTISGIGFSIYKRKETE